MQKVRCTITTAFNTKFYALFHYIIKCSLQFSLTVLFHYRLYNTFLDLTYGHAVFKQNYAGFILLLFYAINFNIQVLTLI